jgi:hypothetical protein
MQQYRLRLIVFRVSDGYFFGADFLATFARKLYLTSRAASSRRADARLDMRNAYLLDGRWNTQSAG